MKNKLWYKTLLCWFWGLFIGSIVIAFITMTLIAKGIVGYLPPLEELQNPKNSFASEIISSDMQSLGRYYKYENGNIQRIPILHSFLYGIFYLL